MSLFGLFSLTFAAALSLAAAAGHAFPVRACVNLGNALDAPEEGAWGPPITAADLAWIAAQGFDTVRLPVRFSAHWDAALSADILARVDTVVAQAQENGLRVILDLHHFDALMADPEGQAPVFYAIWQELSRHYAGHDDGLIFELLNEPHGALEGATLHDLYAGVIPDIRQHNPSRWIILGGAPQNAFDALATLPLTDGRIALSFHYYAPFAFTHQQADWIDTWYPPSKWGSAADEAAVAADFAAIPNLSAPIILGEFGATEQAEASSRVAWTRAVRRAAEARSFAWCHWAYRAGFGLVAADQLVWQDGMRQALFDVPPP